jgi:hypothetical protein
MVSIGGALNMPEDFTGLFTSSIIHDIIISLPYEQPLPTGKSGTTKKMRSPGYWSTVE